jgi:hypothetical protein
MLIRRNFSANSIGIPKNGEENGVEMQEKGIVRVVGWQYFCTME